MSGFHNQPLNMTPKTKATKEKNTWIGLHQNLKHLWAKGHSEENAKMIHRMGKSICKPYFQ